MPPLETASDAAELQIYPWKAAPAHLMTRRQLRAAGLAPGGHAPVAQTETKRYGRRLLTHLYDSRLAVPKRTATPAQLLAVAKAIRERQARAAERRGYDRDELTTTADPGPGWTHNPETTAHKEGNTVSDTEEIRALAQQLETALSETSMQAAYGYDDQAAEAVEAAGRRLDEHLLRHRDVLGSEPHWQSWYESFDRTDAGDAVAVFGTAAEERVDIDRIEQARIDDFFNYDEPKDRDPGPWQIGVPTGHAQRIANVLALAGVNQAREQIKQIRAERERSRVSGPDAIAQFERGLEAERAAAEERLESITWENRWSLTGSVADALTWHDSSDLAAERLQTLRGSFARQWGVQIGDEQLRVTIDPDFDGESVQARAEATARFARQSAAIEMLTDLPLDETVRTAARQALLRWRGEDLDTTPAVAPADVAAQREQLAADLDAAGVRGDDRARIDFVVSYLTGDTARTDLLTSPVFVDVGEEARGRVRELLAEFGEGHISPKQMSREISVMTDADQDHVRAVGKAIVDGKRPDTQVWPDYVNRDAVAENVTLLAGEIEDLIGTANHLAENRFAVEVDDLDFTTESPDDWGVSDQLSATIEWLREGCDELLDVALHGQGLADIERMQLASIVDDIEGGTIRGRADMPELLFADERSKRVLDERRVSHAAAEIANTMSQEVKGVLAEAGLDSNSREGGMANHKASNIRDTVYTVAAGALTNGIDAERRRYTARRNEFGQTLAEAGVEPELRGRIRNTIDAAAHQAGIVGRSADERNQRWDTKIERVAMIRDDQLAQQRAAASARTAPPEAAVAPTRACTARIDQHLTNSPAGIRQLHDMDAGVER